MFSEDEAKALKAFFDGYAQFRREVLESLLQLINDNRRREDKDDKDRAALDAKTHSLQIQMWFLFGTVVVLVALAALMLFYGVN